MSQASKEVESWEEKRVGQAMKVIINAAKAKFDCEPRLESENDAAILIQAIEEEIFANEVQVEA